VAETWRNSSYPKRIQIAVQATEIDGNLSSCPTLIKLTDTQAIVNADLISKRYEIYETGNATPLSYDQESYAEGGTYVNFETWTAVTDLYASPTGDQNKVWLYYGDYDPDSDQDDEGGTWEANYKAVYHMGESQPEDSSGNSHDCTLGTSWAVTSGSIGAARGFSPGSSNYHTAPDHADFDFAGAFMIECWCNPDKADIDGRLVYRYDSSSADGYMITQDDNASGEYRFIVFVGGTAAIASSNAAPSTGSWAHVAGVRESDGTMTLYIDGVAQTDTETQSGALDSNSVLGIGRATWSTPKFYDGDIDEVRLYNGNPTNVAAWIKFQHANVSSADNELTWGSEETYSAGNRRRRLLLAG